MAGAPVTIWECEDELWQIGELQESMTTLWTCHTRSLRLLNYELMVCNE